MTSAGQRENRYPTGSPVGCIHAGNDILMPGMQADLDDTMEALSDKEHVYSATKAELQAAAKRALETALKLD